MGGNTVLSSTSILVENPRHVAINSSALDYTSAKLSLGKFELPAWKMPFYPELDDEGMIDYFLLMNSINFAFTDFNTGQKYSTQYKGTEWKGSSGMAAALTRAIYSGIPLLDGRYLRYISGPEMEDIFEGTIEIPMLLERLEIFHEIGKILSTRYGGQFHNLVSASGRRLFDEGKGLVELLTSEFPSFDDSVVYDGKKIRFDKRAQLAAGMLCGYFQNSPLFEPGEADKLTVFADYVVPKTLRDFGILEYSPDLAEKVDTMQLIPKGSLEELEIRASTIHACSRMIDHINVLKRDQPINSLHLDYRLWSEGRKTPGQHHLTRTINY